MSDYTCTVRFPLVVAILTALSISPMPTRAYAQSMGSPPRAPASSTVGGTAAAPPTDSATASDTGAWVFRSDSDAMTGRVLQQVVLVADSAIVDDAGHSVRPSLIVACGPLQDDNIVPGILLHAGMPLAEEGQRPVFGAATQVLVRTNRDAQPEQKLALFRDRTETTVYLAGFSPFYSPGFMKKLLAATTLMVRFDPLLGGESRTVSFRVSGLGAALKHLTHCSRW